MHTLFSTSKSNKIMHLEGIKTSSRATKPEIVTFFFNWSKLKLPNNTIKYNTNKHLKLLATLSAITQMQDTHYINNQQFDTWRTALKYLNSRGNQHPHFFESKGGPTEKTTQHESQKIWRQTSMKRWNTKGYFSILPSGYHLFLHAFCSRL